MKYPATLTALITLVTAFWGPGIASADDECPMPATQLDQQTAMQALELHDQFATDYTQLAKLKRLLSEDFSIREVGDDDATMMTMDRDSYLSNAKLAAAFSTGIEAKREQVSAHPLDNGLQLRFIETDTGTVMSLPIHIVSRNRADFALQDGCITITAWQFTELSDATNTDADAEDKDPLQQALDQETAKMGIDLSAADPEQRQMIEMLVAVEALKAHSVARIVQVQVDACVADPAWAGGSVADGDDLGPEFERFKQAAAGKVALGDLIYQHGLLGEDPTELKTALDESLADIRTETAAYTKEQLAEECRKLADSLPALITHFSD